MNLELENVELTDFMAESPWNYCCSTASIRRQLMQMHDIWPERPPVKHCPISKRKISLDSAL